MNVCAFSVATTNIFPLANSASGGQLVTEFNLKSRESVATDPEVGFIVGHSFTHSASDFELGTADTAGVLLIGSGRSVIDGHYFESLVPVEIDMVALNAQRASQGLAPLKGKLLVGLRAMYSTEQTISGSMLAEDGDAMQQGIQVVVAPPAEFILPSATSTRDTVTAHLKLGEFVYESGSIDNIVNEEESKLAFLDGSRIKDIGSELASSYVSKEGLNPKRIYTYSGKEGEPGSTEPSELGWCDSTSSMVDWGEVSAAPSVVPSNAPEFRRKTNDQVPGMSLIIPRKQIDGWVNKFPDVDIPIPLADTHGAVGLVSEAYTNWVKQISNQVEMYYALSGGSVHMRGFVETLTIGPGTVGTELPDIVQTWSAGDFVVVSQDKTQDIIESGRYPSTLYVVDGTPLAYQPPVFLTGTIPLATESAVGGFLNVPSDTLGDGYVYLDDSGHLRVADFELLASGTLAYRLSGDFNQGAGLELSELQYLLDDVVNARVAFTDPVASSQSGCIHIYLDLPADTNAIQTLNLYDIDSRFGTYIYLHIEGEAGPNTYVNISNCQKVRIDPNIQGTPVVNLYNSCLYYDSIVMDYLAEIDGLSLWYEKDIASSADITIDGLTVSGDSALASAGTVVEWWKGASKADSDLHLGYQLRSITFDTHGEVVGASAWFTDLSSLTSVSDGDRYVLYKILDPTNGDEMPQPVAFTYPTNRLVRPIKISGSFVSGYWGNNQSNYYCHSCEVSLQLPYWGGGQQPTKGCVSVLATAHVFDPIDVVNGTSGQSQQDIPSWEGMHVLYGGVVS